VNLLTLLRIACRLAMIAASLALAALLIEPSWRSESRTLELRVRRAPEIAAAARSLGDRVLRGKERLPAVASGRDGKKASGDELTDEDRRLLQRLVEEKLRE
jgi:hypothetical protein